jgi:hypothetical protein
VIAGLKKWSQQMNDNNLEYYYNGDDWRLFDPNQFNTVINLDIKEYQKFGGYDLDDHPSPDQVAYYIQKIKNRPF